MSQLLEKGVIIFIGIVNSMEIKQKIDDLLKKRNEIDDQISQLKYELIQKEHIQFSQLVGQYIKKCKDTYTVTMYVRKAVLFDGNYHLLGPAIRNYFCGDYELLTKSSINAEFNLSDIEIISKDEWDDSLHKIKEIIDNTITGKKI